MKPNQAPTGIDYLHDWSWQRVSPQIRRQAVKHIKALHLALKGKFGVEVTVYKPSSKRLTVGIRKSDNHRSQELGKQPNSRRGRK